MKVTIAMLYTSKYKNRLIFKKSPGNSTDGPSLVIVCPQSVVDKTCCLGFSPPLWYPEGCWVP